MHDLEALFERLVAAHRTGAFWDAFLLSPMASAPVLMHPLGFRVAKVEGAERTREAVRAVPRESSARPAGTTYGLRAGEFHRLDRASVPGAATLVLTRSGDGRPRTLGPLDGADAVRFRRERLPYAAARELALVLAATKRDA